MNDFLQLSSTKCLTWFLFVNHLKILDGWCCRTIFSIEFQCVTSEYFDERRKYSSRSERDFSFYLHSKMEFDFQDKSNWDLDDQNRKNQVRSCAKIKTKSKCHRMKWVKNDWWVPFDILLNDRVWEEWLWAFVDHWNRWDFFPRKEYYPFIRDRNTKTNIVDLCDYSTTLINQIE